MRTAIWETPEIDGVRRCFETTGSDFGDGLSDSYWRMIDYATDPMLDDDTRNRRVTRELNRLAREDRYISQCLITDGEYYDVPELYAGYQSVLEQVLNITGIVLDNRGNL